MSTGIGSRRSGRGSSNSSRSSSWAVARNSVLLILVRKVLIKLLTSMMSNGRDQIGVRILNVRVPGCFRHRYHRTNQK